MKTKNDLPAPYLVYLVRCWPVETEQGLMWRASIEEPCNSEPRHFADLLALYRFFDAETTKAIAIPPQSAQQQRED